MQLINIPRNIRSFSARFIYCLGTSGIGRALYSFYWGWRHSVAAWKPLAFRIVIITLISRMQAVMAADSNDAAANVLSTNSPFVLYLANPPWAKSIRYADKELVQLGETKKVWRTR